MLHQIGLQFADSFLVRQGLYANDADKTLQEFSDGTMLSNGNIVFARKIGAGEMTPEKKLISNYDAPKGFKVHVCKPIGIERVP